MRCGVYVMKAQNYELLSRSQVALRWLIIGIVDGAIQMRVRRALIPLLPLLHQEMNFTGA